MDKRSEEECLSTAIRELILDLESGRFTSRWIDGELRIETKEERNIRRQTLLQLKKKGIIEYMPDLVGVYRRVDGTLNVLEWQKADPAGIFKMKFPFHLENYVVILPKNEIIVAGDKDSGKTALLLNIARLNMDDYDITYFSSEMGELELRHRLQRFEDEGLVNMKNWKCEWVERDSNFADVIRPDGVNIIDFLEVYDEFYKVGGYINQIYRRLRNGVAIIALQKNMGAELGVGKGRSIEKARLYLTMGSGKLTIKSAKNWAQETVNPVGKEFKYKLIKGAKFVSLDKSFGEEQDGFF